MSPEDYEVFHYFIEQQKDNPEYWDSLAEKLWEDLTPEDRAARTALNVSFFPDDLADRARSIKVGLLRDHIRQQVIEMRLLNTMFELPADDSAIPAIEATDS
jgi:hypothetical protein